MSSMPGESDRQTYKQRGETMRIFTIDQENNITVSASEKQTKAGETNGTEIFTTQEGLAKLAGEWPSERLVQIWNSLPGVDPVKKFTDRKTAIARIWKAIQSLQPAASEDGREKAAPSRDVRPRSTKPAKATRKAKAQKKVARDAKGPREGSKTSIILDLIRRPKGATLEELMTAAGWQVHSVRGFLSAVVGKKMKLKLESSKREDGKRLYQLAS
jgi:hypothetical protein